MGLISAIKKMHSNDVLTLEQQYFGDRRYKSVEQTAQKSTEDVHTLPLKPVQLHMRQPILEDWRGIDNVLDDYLKQKTPGIPEWSEPKPNRIKFLGDAHGTTIIMEGTCLDEIKSLEYVAECKQTTSIETVNDQTQINKNENCENLSPVNGLKQAHLFNGRMKRTFPFIYKMLKRKSHRNVKLLSGVGTPPKLCQNSGDQQIDLTATQCSQTHSTDGSCNSRTTNTSSSPSSHFSFERTLLKNDTDESSVNDMNFSFSALSIGALIVPPNIDELDSFISNDCKEFNVAAAQKFKLLCSDQTPRLWETTGHLPHIEKLH